MLDNGGHVCWTMKDMYVGQWRTCMLDNGGHACWTMEDMYVGQWRTFMLDCEVGLYTVSNIKQLVLDRIMDCLIVWDLGL